MLGWAIRVTESVTDQLADRISGIHAALSQPEINAYDSKILKDRLAKLSGGVATIKVAGLSPIEVQHSTDLVTDAISATKASLEEGIVPGGGSALLGIYDY